MSLNAINIKHAGGTEYNKVHSVHACQRYIGTLCVSRINSNLIVQKLYQTDVHKGNKESFVLQRGLDCMHTCNTKVRA